MMNRMTNSIEPFISDKSSYGNSRNLIAKEELIKSESKIMMKILRRFF